MRKDVKIGMLAGTVLCGIGMVVFSFTAPSISDERQEYYRQTQRHNTAETTAVTPTEPIQQPQQPPLDASTKVTSQSPVIPDLFIPKTTSPIVVPTNNIRYHTVTKGQTLTSIALDYYGTTTKVNQILKANNHLIQNADQIKIGMQLKIPKDLFHDQY